MTNRHGDLDANMFLRATSLFEEKRKFLAPQAVRDLAEDIVQRVSTMKHALRKGAEDDIPHSSVAAFCERLLHPSPANALQFILDLQAQGVDRATIMNTYLAGAARMLGAKWEADEVGLIDVIHGTGHLYSLLRALRPGPTSDSATALGRRNALFALVPGETHRFGVQLAAETFREAGWNIDLQIGLGHDELITHAHRTEPTIIGLSLSTEERLADLVRLVVALRLERPSAIIGVAPALNMEDKTLRNIVDIDLVFRDANTAMQDLDWLRQLKS